MGEQISFGLIGCGRIGNRHAAHMQAHGKLVAVCDTDKNKADALARKYQAVPFYNISEFLYACAKIDLVAVCTPNGLHAEHTIGALAAGCHVLCEKPLAITSKDCRNMIDAAAQYDRRLFVVKQNRFNPPVQTVKKLLETNELGRIFSIQLNCFWNRDNNYYKNSWHGSKALDGGILYTQFSHFIDLVYWYFGDIDIISAMGSNFAHDGIIEFDDTVIAICRFKSGILGTFHFTINAHERNMEGSLSIFAEQGTVKIGGQYLNELEYSTVSHLSLKNLTPGNPANNYGDYKGSMSNHNLVYQNIVNVLLGNEKPIADISDGLKTVAIIESIYSLIPVQAYTG